MKDFIAVEIFCISEHSIMEAATQDQEEYIGWGRCLNGIRLPISLSGTQLLGLGRGSGAHIMQQLQQVEPIIEVLSKLSELDEK
ncbi:hypothetical protein [Tumebacillus algifaecis]|uniref:hypothetical protein n=1 Tax=Tumebacillus algifaecis TaxID=1214604 RepID=UPI0012FD4AE1|nr:hypothetical protein [Tumebacillus algifaecis]